MVFMKKHFYLLLTFLILFLPNFDLLADSIAGGRMEITHVSGDTYKITVTLFVDETNTTTGISLYNSTTKPWIGIYSKGATPAGDVFIDNKQLTVDRKESFPYDGIECVTSSTLATQKVTLSTTVSLPGVTFNNALGYYIVYADGYRNNSDNIFQSNTTGITLYTEFPRLNGGTNSSPVFKLQRGIVACLNQPYTIDLGADDADGNTRSYAVVRPFSGPGRQTINQLNGIRPVPRNASATDPITFATFNASYNLGNVIPGLSLNTSTGVLSGTPTQEGTFFITVECRESRGGTQIGLVRQDVQIRVERCVPPEPKIYVQGGNPTIHVPSVVICEFSFKVLETADLVGATYQWFKDGTAVAGATKNKLKILYADAGNYTVEVTRTGACAGTRMSLNTQVTQQPGVNIKLDVATKSYCEGENLLINVNGLPIATGSVNKWFKDGVPIPNPFPANSYIVSGVAPKDSGLYRIEVTENAGDKCVYEDSVRIKVTPIPVATITNVTGLTVVCQGKVIILQAPASPNVSYQWTRDAVFDSNGALKNVLQSGSYGLTVTSTVNPNCFAAASPINITVNPNPLVTFNPIPASCSNKSAKIDLINLVSPQSPVGTFTGTGVSGTEFDPSRSGYGSFPITYTYTTSEGCLGNVVSQTAVVDLTPVIKLGNDFTIFRGDTVRIKSVGSVGSQFMYEWTPVAGILPSITAPQPLVSPVLSTRYKVKVTTVLGKCSAEDEVLITVRPKLKFANAFTPNNDAINDTWEIEGIGEYPNAEVTIFNRWGGEMFYSIGYNQAFDGIQKNERLPAGTYFYVIKPSPDVPTLTGYLTIVR
jgi:gliding motility-associated-like protein